MPHHNDSERISYLTRKWRDGNITIDEKLELDRWYNDMDDVNDKNYTLNETVKERIYQSILRKENIKFNKNPKTFQTRRIILVSAAFSLLGFLTFWWWQNKYTPNIDHVNIAKADKSIRKTLLPDGTIIWLKPGSTISYPDVFGKTRKVTLTGEALFEVAKDKKHPFLITAGNYTATVLGTSFNLKESKNNNIELVVLTGKVRIASKDNRASFKPVDVFPAEKLETSARVQKLPVARSERKQYVEGTQYDMDFVNSPFGEVAARIENKFNVKLQFSAGQYAHCRFTADLTDQSLSHTMELLTTALNATYQISKDKISINEGGCQ